MSSRQIRRLQDLVKSSTGIDEEEEEISFVQIKPNVTGKGKRRKKNEFQVDKASKTSATSWDEKITQSNHALQLRAASRDSQARKEGYRFGSTRRVQKPQEGTIATENKNSKSMSTSTADASASSSRVASSGDAAGPSVRAGRDLDHRNRAQKPQMSKKAQREAEEQFLLDAVLRQRGQSGGDSAPVSSPKSREAEFCLGELMLVCDPDRLDMRQERIRNFGVEAVEDVGDGSTPPRLHGRVRDTNSNSLFPEHRMKLSFRSSVFGTPNRYRWPPYDSLGTRMVIEDKNSDDSCILEGVRKTTGYVIPALPSFYRLNCNAALFKQAEHARLACLAQMGNPQDLLNCLSQGFYHVPTLLQLFTMFRALGNTVRASEMVDLALYHVGVLLSRFPIADTWRKRLILYDCPENHLLFQTLRCGVHVALQRGCPSTAWEISRFVLSLDPRDPAGMLLLMDYLALRAKRWVWLIQVHQSFLSVLSNCFPLTAHASKESSQGEEVAKEAGEAEQGSLSSPPSSNWIDSLLARQLLVLPSFAFSAALAKHFLERDMQHHREEASRHDGTSPSASFIANQGGRSKKKPQPNSLRGITPTQRAILEAAPSATSMLAQAMVRFPVAAVQLVERLQGVDTICKGATVDSNWYDKIVQRAMKEEKGYRDCDQTLPRLQNQLNLFFVTRHTDLWKSAESTKLLRSVLAPGRESAESNASSFTTAVCPTPLGTALEELRLVAHHCEHDEATARMYLKLQEEDVMGLDSNVAVPQEMPNVLEAENDGDILAQVASIAQQALNEADADLAQVQSEPSNANQSSNEPPLSQQERLRQFFLSTFMPWWNRADASEQQDTQMTAHGSGSVSGENEDLDWEDIETSSSES